MVKWPLIVLALLCLIVAISWLRIPAVKQLTIELGPLVTLVSSILTLTIFLQFYNEFQKNVAENEEKKLEQRARHNSKMVALGSEIVSNIQLCNLFESEKDRHLTGNEVPNVYFQYSVSQGMIVDGDVGSHRLRSELMSLIVQMESLNKLIETQRQLMVFKGFASTDKNQSIKETTVNSMRLLHSKIPLIRKQLADVQPLFMEYWDERDKFLEEKYLKERMIPEGLIR